LPNRDRWWLWVPAFAGTTKVGKRVDSKNFQAYVSASLVG
jgi:hypothetical protein